MSCRCLAVSCGCLAVSCGVLRCLAVISRTERLSLYLLANKHVYKNGYIFFITHTHIFLHLYYKTTNDAKGKHCNSLLISQAFWAKQHLTVTLTLKDHWPRDPHDLAERIFITISFFRHKGKQSRFDMMTISEHNRKTILLLSNIIPNVPNVGITM